MSVPCSSSSETSPPPTASSTAPDSAPPAQNPLPENYEHDFVNKPPKDFYCAVSLELLLDPHQTDCCGHHFTREIAEKLKSDGKPCPMCKKEKLTTHTDLYHKRRVNEVAVRCLHRATGNCAWVGELGNLPHHVTHCPKQPWKCTHCNFTGLKEAETQHTSTCELFPVQCPNNCEARTVPRSHLDQHVLECPLEEVGCKYATFGCTERFPRRDLKKHLEEREKEHLLTMCAMNLTLTQQLVRKVEEKDDQIAQLQSQVREMERELKKSVHSIEEATGSRILEVQRKVISEVKGLGELVSKSESAVVSSLSSMQRSFTDLQQQVDTISCKVAPVEFTVTNFEALKTHQLEWRSPPIYTHQGGYKMCIGIFPYGLAKGFGTHVSLRVYKMLDLNSDHLPWNIRIILHVHILNQSTKVWEREYLNDSVRSKPGDSCVGSSAEYHYLQHSELRHYVKNDRLRVRVTDLHIGSDTWCNYCTAS